MSDITISEEKKQGLLHFLRQELSVFPGRYNAMLRYLLSSVIVITISISLDIPMLSFSLLVIFLAIQKNIVLDRKIFPLFIINCTIAVGFSILILKLTIDHPMMRLLFTAILLMASLYFMRASKLGFLYFGTAITITYAQSFVDLSSNGEMLLRNCLWSWVAGCYATLVVYIVNTLFLPVEPVNQLKQKIEHSLNLVTQLLYDTAQGKKVKPIELKDIQIDILTLHEYLKFSMVRNPFYRKNEGRYLAKISTIERLHLATRYLPNLAECSLPADAARYFSLLAKECQLLKKEILSENDNYQVTALTEDIEELPECLQEMYSALLNVPILDAHQKNTPSASSASPSPESKPNKNKTFYLYIKYAVKIQLCVAICYIFYTSTQWSGIHTSMLTCIIVALPSLGSSMQKSVLRIAGCLVGSLLALLSTVFILPHLDTIVGLLLMVTPVIAFSAWVITGSERSSYAGLQILFAFSLAMFVDYSPTPEIPEIRDRLIGILLGIGVSTIVHSLIWPETGDKTLRQSIAGLFTYFDQRINLHKLDVAVQIEGWKKLDATQKLLAQAALETGWRSNGNEQLKLNCQALLGILRELHVALFRLESEYIQASFYMNNDNKVLFPAIERVIGAVQTAIKAYGEGLQHEPVIPVSIEKMLTQVTLSDILTPIQTDREKKLLRRVCEVVTLCRSIPQWRLIWTDPAPVDDPAL